MIRWPTYLPAYLRALFCALMINYLITESFTDSLFLVDSAVIRHLRSCVLRERLWRNAWRKVRNLAGSGWFHQVTYPSFSYIFTKVKRLKKKYFPTLSHGARSPLWPQKQDRLGNKLQRTVGCSQLERPHKCETIQSNVLATWMTTDSMSCACNLQTTNS